MQSISSKREPSGWSKCERPRSKLSRQRKRRPRRAARDREGDGERAVVLGVLAEARRIHRDLVGDRAERRQHARAAHHQAAAGFLDHAQRGAFLQVEHAGDVAAALQVDQRVRQDDVVLADELVVAADVLRELRPVAAEVVRGGGPGGERHVHEVGRAPHHAAGGARPVQHHHAAGFEFFARARVDERQADAIAGGGRGVGHLVAELRIALHVVERGDRPRAAGETRMRGHVLDAFAAQPDFTILFPQAVQVFSSRASRHGASLPLPGPQSATRTGLATSRD